MSCTHIRRRFRSVGQGHRAHSNRGVQDQDCRTPPPEEVFGGRGRSRSIARRLLTLALVFVTVCMLPPDRAGAQVSLTSEEIYDDKVASFRARKDGFYRRTARDGRLEFDARLFPGNSGGPVLDSSGRLVGIATTADYRGRNTRAWAVPTQAIVALLATVQESLAFSVTNLIPGRLHLQYRWAETDAWKTETIDRNRWLAIRRSSNEAPDSGFPQVRFDSLANDDVVTYTVYRLGAFR